MNYQRPLSRRQWEIAKAMATDHLQQKALAQKFCCSVRTMRWYAATVKSHFGVSDRMALMIFWTARRRQLSTYERYRSWVKKYASTPQI